MVPVSESAAVAFPRFFVSFPPVAAGIDAEAGTLFERAGAGSTGKAAILARPAGVSPLTTKHT